MHRKFRKHQQIEKYAVQNLHKKTAEVFWGEIIMWRTRYETEQLIANMYPHCYMKNATKTHITCMFFLTHNTDETISSFKRLSANLCGFYRFHSCSVMLLSPKNTWVVFCIIWGGFLFVFLTCFIQLPLGIACSYSIFIFADVFLSHSVFDFSGPPYFGPGFIFALCCQLCVHK